MANFARDYQGEPYGYQGREYLRKKYIGETVEVILEFKKNIDIIGKDEKQVNLVLQQATVFHKGVNLSE